MENEQKEKSKGKVAGRKVPPFKMSEMGQERGMLLGMRNLGSGPGINFCKCGLDNLNLSSMSLNMSIGAASASTRKPSPAHHLSTTNLMIHSFLNRMPIARCDESTVRLDDEYKLGLVNH